MKEEQQRFVHRSEEQHHQLATSLLRGRLEEATPLARCCRSEIEALRFQREHSAAVMMKRMSLEATKITMRMVLKDLQKKIGSTGPWNFQPEIVWMTRWMPNTAAGWCDVDYDADEKSR